MVICRNDRVGTWSQSNIDTNSPLAYFLSLIHIYCRGPAPVVAAEVLPPAPISPGFPVPLPAVPDGRCAGCVRYHQCCAAGWQRARRLSLIHISFATQRQHTAYFSRTSERFTVITSLRLQAKNVIDVYKRQSQNCSTLNTELNTVGALIGPTAPPTPIDVFLLSTPPAFNAWQ